MRTQLRFILTARPLLGLLRWGSCWLVLVLASGLSAQAQCFQGTQNYGVGSDPRSVAIGDLNGDGKTDLVTTNASSNTVSVLLGDGRGRFGAPTNYGVGNGSYPFSVAIEDFNGDGKADLVTANLITNNVSVLLGDGSGRFGTATTYGVGSNPNLVAVGDFNGDGKADLVTADFNSGAVSVLLNDGSGRFGSAITYGVGSTPQSVAIGDFNGDGKADLVTANVGSNNVSVLLNDGSGRFGRAITYGVGSNHISVATRDLNGDGKADLVTANLATNNVSVLLGDGSGRFGTATTYGVGSGPISVAIGDVNGDSKPDLVTANYFGNTVSMLLGDGNGGYGAPTNYGVGSSPRSVAIGDLNGDSKPDLVAANQSSNNVSVLLNAQPSLAQNGSANPTTCGGNQGSISFTTTNLANGDYSLKYSLGGNARTASVTVSNNGFTLDNLAAGSYSGFSINSSGCVASLAGSITLTGPAQPNLVQGVVGNPTTCGGNQGSIAFATTNLVDGPYSLSYSVGGSNLTASITVSNNGFSLSGLGAGQYSNFAISSNGCVATLPGAITLAGPAQPTLAQKATSNPTICEGINGTIRFTTTNLANGPYSLSYSAGGNNQSASITVSNNGFTLGNLAAGSYAGFSITSNACVASLPGAITLTDPTPPTASLTQNGPLTCAQTSVTLTANATPGASLAFSGPGGALTSSDNRASVSSPGTFTLSASLNGCTTTTTTTVSSDTLAPALTISPSATAICAGQSVTLMANATTPGGTLTYRWNTTATSPSITLSPASTSPYSVTVARSDNGCVATATANVRVNALPTPAIVGLASAYCQDTGQQPLSGNPSGGVFTVDGLLATVLDPASLSVGQHSVVYSYTSTSGCVATATASVTVNALPTPSIVGLASAYCQDAPALTLAPLGNPAGGSFTIDGSPATVLEPARLSVGDRSVRYRYTDNNGCSNSASQTVTVKPTPTAPTLMSQAGGAYPGGVSSLTIAQNVGNVILTVSGCQNGTISWNGGNSTTLAVSTTNLGTQTVTATCTSNGCTSPTATATVTVVAPTLKVLSRDPDNGQLGNNTIKPYLLLQNAGTTPIPYSTITLRYWLTTENTIPLLFQKNYVAIGQGNLNLRYVPLATPRQGATGYIEYSFSGGAGSLAPNGDSGPLEVQATKQDYSVFNQRDDYSYINNSAYTLNARITAYQNGVIFYGQEPTGTGSPRQAVAEAGSLLEAQVLGNPVVGQTVEIEISGVAGQAVQLKLTNLQGKTLTSQSIPEAGQVERVSVPLGNGQGLLLLEVSTATQRQQIKLLRP